jgi:hypothetical protein
MTDAALAEVQRLRSAEAGGPGWSPALRQRFGYGIRGACFEELLWGTAPKDTFPAHDRMNARATLRALFGAAGFAEENFQRLDDCRAFARWPATARAELATRRALRSLGIPYPDACLLGVYRLGGAA